VGGRRGRGGRCGRSTPGPRGSGRGRVLGGRIRATAGRRRAAVPQEQFAHLAPQVGIPRRRRDQPRTSPPASGRRRSVSSRFGSRAALPAGPVCRSTGPAGQDVHLGRVEVAGARRKSSATRPPAVHLRRPGGAAPSGPAGGRRSPVEAGRGLVGFPCAFAAQRELHATAGRRPRFVEPSRCPPPRPPVPALKDHFAAQCQPGAAVVGPVPRLARVHAFRFRSSRSRFSAVAHAFATGLQVCSTSAPVGSPRSTRLAHVRRQTTARCGRFGVSSAMRRRKSGSNRRELPELRPTSARSRATASGTSAGGRPRRGAARRRRVAVPPAAWAARSCFLRAPRPGGEAPVEMGSGHAGASASRAAAGLLSATTPSPW